MKFWVGKGWDMKFWMGKGWDMKFWMGKGWDMKFWMGKGWDMKFWMGKGWNMKFWMGKGWGIIESVDSISKDERGFPLTQYITNGRISRARYTITHFKHHHRVLRLISYRLSV